MNDAVQEVPWPEPDIYCQEIRIAGPGGAAWPPFVMVGPGYSEPQSHPRDLFIDETGRVNPPVTSCSPAAALRAATHLVRWALVQVGERTAGLRDLGWLVDELWPVLREQAYDLIHPDERGDSKRCSKLLRHYVEREVQHRVTETLASQREAARLSGLEAAQDTIRRLWQIAAEDNPQARAVALAAISGEVRQTIGRL